MCSFGPVRSPTKLACGHARNETLNWLRGEWGDAAGSKYTVSCMDRGGQALAVKTVRRNGKEEFSRRLIYLDGRDIVWGRYKQYILKIEDMNSLTWHPSGKGHRTFRWDRTECINQAWGTSADLRNAAPPPPPHPHPHPDCRPHLHDNCGPTREPKRRRGCNGNANDMPLPKLEKTWTARTGEIEMLASKYLLTKGRRYIVVGESDTGASWRVLRESTFAWPLKKFEGKHWRWI